MVDRDLWQAELLSFDRCCAVCVAASFSRPTKAVFFFSFPSASHPASDPCKIKAAEEQQNKSGYLKEEHLDLSVAPPKKSGCDLELRDCQEYKYSICLKVFVVKFAAGMSYFLVYFRLVLSQTKP